MSVNLWNPNNLEIHCEYCSCPLEIWEKSPKALTTYSGDECRLISSFFDMIFNELPGTPTHEWVFGKATTVLPHEFPEITDLEGTIKELMAIADDLGLLD